VGNCFELASSSYLPSEISSTLNYVGEDLRYVEITPGIREPLKGQFDPQQEEPVGELAECSNITCYPCMSLAVKLKFEINPIMFSTFQIHKSISHFVPHIHIQLCAIRTDVKLRSPVRGNL